VPAIFDAEIFSATKRWLRRGIITRDRAEAMLLSTARLAAERRTVTDLLAEAFALRDRFGSHDVFYVALARRLGATLVTTDRPLARAATGYVDVTFVGG
jgi:predicted nucleic acid-binding protein